MEKLLQQQQQQSSRTCLNIRNKNITNLSIGFGDACGGYVFSSRRVDEAGNPLPILKTGFKLSPVNIIIYMVIHFS